jgi:hypothetical protein
MKQFMPFHLKEKTWASDANNKRKRIEEEKEKEQQK